MFIRYPDLTEDQKESMWELASRDRLVPWEITEGIYDTDESGVVWLLEYDDSTPQHPC